MNTVRVSKYRHVYGKPVQKEKCHDNIRLTKNAFDSNFAKANPKYISLNWQSSGGGSFAVLPHSQTGKLPDRFPLFDGHKGAVLDTDWNPFDEDCVVSASDDGTIGVWRVPSDLDVMKEAPLDEVQNIGPIGFLSGHGKRVGHVLFNPVAKNILASSGFDNTIKIWDLEKETCLFTLPHPQQITSFSWNHDGSQIASTCKDKRIRVWDVRAQKVLSEGTGHLGTKSMRLVWLGDHDRLATTGFSRMSEREMALWDSKNLEKGPIGDYRRLDPSSGVVIPFYDWETSILYLGGRGDGKIVYYEFTDDNLYDLFVFQSTIPQRGLAFLPDRALNVHEHEVARIYKVQECLIEPIPFYVPRKTEGFLEGIYTVCHAKEPALSADEWMSGKSEKPLVYEWKTIWEGSDPKPKPLKEALEEVKKSEAATKSAAAENEKGGDENGHSVTKDSKAVTEPSPTAEKAAVNKADKQESNDVLQAKDAKEFLAKAKEEESSSSEDAAGEDTWDQDEEIPSGATTETKVEGLKESDTTAGDSEVKKENPEVESGGEAPKDGEKEVPPEPKSTKAESDLSRQSVLKDSTEDIPKDVKKPEAETSEKAGNNITELAKERVREAEESLKEAESVVEKAEEPMRESLEEHVHDLMATVDGLVKRIEKLEAKK